MRLSDSDMLRTLPESSPSHFREVLDWPFQHGAAGGVRGWTAVVCASTDAESDVGEARSPPQEDVKRELASEVASMRFLKLVFCCR